MIDINQLPKNPAWDRWKDELRAEGEARLLLCVLHRRGFVAGADVEARLLSTTDPARIERWADLALDAPSLDAVFADD